MLARDMLIKQFEYNYWANGRIYDQAELVDERQWTLPAPPEQRSLQETLAHMVYTERMWRLLSAHEYLDSDDLVPMEQLTTVQAQRDLSNTEEELMLILLQDWSDEAFSEELLITRWDGVQIPLVRWHMLQHLLAHSMQHRSEAAALLTQYGRSPGDLDFIFFV